jgi:hypothetical protein
MAFSPEERRVINAAANRAASKAVKDTLTMLGIDTSSPAAVVEFQQDIAFMRRTRMWSGARNSKLALALLGLAITAIGGVVVTYIRKLMGW